MDDENRTWKYDCRNNEQSGRKGVVTEDSKRAEKMSVEFDNCKVGAQTETELKEKKLRVEDTLNATKVVKCCLEHAASVAKTFLMSDCVVEIKEPEPVPTGNPMENSGYVY